MTSREEIIALYAHTDKRLRALVEQLSVGNLSRRHQDELNRQIDVLIEELTNTIGQSLAALIGEEYRSGATAAVSQLAAAGVTANNSLKSVIHQRAAQAIMNEAHYSILQASNYMSEDAKQRIKDAVRLANEKSLTLGMSRLEATKQAVAELNTKGITGIIAKNGAEIPADKYMNGVVHYHQRKAHVTGTENMATQNGYDLVFVNYVGITCDHCAGKQGRVYSLSGTDKRWPPMTDENRPPYHSHCVHSLSIWIEEYASPEEVERLLDISNRPGEETRSEQHIKRYKEIQAQKAQLNSDRKQWEQYRLAAPDATPKTFSSFRRMKYNDSTKWEELKAAKQSHLNKQDYSNRMFGQFGNREVREWYNAHDKEIVNLIDKSAPLKEQAIQAHSLRNQYRSEARLMMQDRALAEQLDREQPHKPFDVLLQDKMERKGLSIDEAYQDIIDTAGKTNKQVNRKLGLEE